MGFSNFEKIQGSLLILINIFIPTIVFAGQSHVFATWEGFEVDKCATIWLIKNHIDKNSVITFYPKGTVLEGGVSFDTPDSDFKRTFNKSTYEALLDYYKIEDPALIYIGKIVHDIEINTWEKKKLKETRSVQAAINQMIGNISQKNDLIEKSNLYFDRLYKSLK